MRNNCLIIFVKYPEPGQVKSRLAKDFDDLFAADLYKAFVLDILERTQKGNWQLRVFFDPPEKEDEIKIMLEKDCFHVYQPDATFAGGIAQVKRVIDECKKRDRLYSPHTWTNGIGFYVNWNLVLADRDNKLPLEYPLEYPSWIPEYREGIISPIIPDKNAMLQPFKRPGLGFEIDKKLLKKYGKRFFRMTETGLKIKVIREKGILEALRLKKRKDSRE